jgi:type I restriction enzyme R subunit
MCSIKNGGLGDSLRDSFASRGFDLVENCLIIKEEYRQRVEAKVLEIVETHPTIAAIRNGEAVTDLQLVALERILRQELGGGNVQLSESNIRKAFNLKVNSLLSFLRELFEIEALPDYQDFVRRNFEDFIAQRQFNSNQIQFLRAVQNVFLKKRRLEVPDLYEAPLDRFGEDARKVVY